MASGHIVASFDEDLAELNTMLARLGGLAEKQFADAMDALERRDIQNIDEIIARDAELDEMEFNLNERGIEIIALRAPVARDLRRVIVTLKVRRCWNALAITQKMSPSAVASSLSTKTAKATMSVLRAWLPWYNKCSIRFWMPMFRAMLIWLWMCATVTWKLTACIQVCSGKYWRACPRPRSRSLPDRICFSSPKILNGLAITQQGLPSKFSSLNTVDIQVRSALRPISRA